MDKITGVTTVVGAILSILTFYYTAYLPYIGAQNAPATTSNAMTPINPIVLPVNPQPQPASEPLKA
ncbi:MAG: hypothetical protein ACJ70N_05550, partial [Nitrososphaera sp.]